MGARWMWFVVMLAAATALQFAEEQYYEMPRLYYLDDYEACLASQRGAYCLGTFDLLSYNNERLMNIVQKYSSKEYFNHTLIHRGYCVSSRCSHIDNTSLPISFEACVDSFTRAEYGLAAKLRKLEYCETGGQPSRPIDTLDVVFACVVGVVVLCNLAGTTYDLMRSNDRKQNRYLMSWSLIANWKRLTADYSDGDPKLSALRPLQGMKANTLILVMMAHSVLAHHVAYTYNPQFFEIARRHVLTAYFKNGTSIVHTFTMVSSFLLAYNLLLHADKNPTQELSLATLPRCLIHRIIRIAPVYLFVLGVATTWWAHAGEGPQWAPLVEGERARCRHKWWTHALFVNNLVRSDVTCLVHTWFLAVDMQLYAVSAVLTLVLARWRCAALRLLAALLLATMVLNFTAIYYWRLKPIVVLMFPERMRRQFQDEASFRWLYTAPWDSLPAALIGLFVAFLHHSLQQEGRKPEKSLTIRVLYRATVPLMFLWVVAGHWMSEVTDRTLVSLYATLDRPVVVSMTAFLMLGFFNKIDSVWWRYLSWRGWQLAARMSLSVYLAHWLLALALLAARPSLPPLSVNDVAGHWLSTVGGGWAAGAVLHLLVELPAQRSLGAVTARAR